MGHGTVGALTEAGHEVRCMVRRKSLGKAPEGEGVEKFVVDFVNAGRLAQGMEGCEAVFNLAGIIRDFPDEGTTFRKVHIDFTRQLIDACEAAGVKRYLHMSALGVDSGLKVGYNTSKLAAENIVRESGLEWTIFRPSLIFGPGDRFAVEFAGWMRRGRPIPVIGRGDYRLMPVGRTDLCRGMVKLISNENSIGKTYNIGGPERLSYIDILRIIEKSSGAKMRLVKLSAFLIESAAAVMGGFRWFPASKDMIRMLLKESITEEADFWRDTGIQARKLADALPEYL